MPQAMEFNSIRITVASPDQVKQWSYGEVTKPETVNYRTLRPEKDGLFCERIFGPTKDWECYCGKYKKIRYRGVVCDRCGVEVARAKVRRERMGHIKLAAPVAHIWFAKGIPSRLGLLIDLAPRNLERVLYFAQYIVTSVDELMRDRAVESITKQHEEAVAALELENETDEPASKEGPTPDSEVTDSGTPQDIEPVQTIESLQAAYRKKIDDLEGIRQLQLLTESKYRDLNEQFGEVFQAGMGAEAILEILKGIDLNELIIELEDEMRSTSGQRRKKAVKRMRVVQAFRKSNNRPEWMVLTMLPVLPPDLRPMVQLDGGRFATSDLNDLYRRVINRNNRLRRLLDLGAPQIIVRNEKRMLQEAVDDLIDNGRRSRAIVGNHNHKLKSLSDLLRGKQGRFRQNLLGKRVDYGGRSVIVVGPNLQLHQCGLPKKMALELFKPFVMNRLVMQGIAHNIKSAKRLVDRMYPEVWDILETVIEGRPVLLNRAPTLHRLGIQAFMPVLVEGSAIQLHPLVCAAFNADFDGDQMAVHVPLSREAVMEALKTMLSTQNMLSPASGEPLVTPTHEIVLGCYYLTSLKIGGRGEGKIFSDFEDALLAFESGHLELQSLVKVRDSHNKSDWIEVTPGRIIFNQILPENVRRYDAVMDKKVLKEVITDLYHSNENAVTAQVLDRIKEIGFRYATVSGTTIGITDIEVPPEKTLLLLDADKQVEALEGQFEEGLITELERHNRTINIWQGVSSQMDKMIADHLPEFGGIYMMAHSGARGNETQIKQMAGMRGLMSNPRGDIIDLPIKSSFREGLTVLEYFISTHGARKGLADTALRTADSGYLTRRLVDVAQEVIITEDDCNSDRGVWIFGDPSEEDVMLGKISERIPGRVTAAPIFHPDTGEMLLDADEEISDAIGVAIQDAGIRNIYVRSPFTCGAERGMCKKCYGRSPASGKNALMGDAVGIIAAQSIGEPGTQLTMRTFHTGGVAGKDITSGLPRVEELFEARSPKGRAKLAEVEGEIVIFSNGQLEGSYNGKTLEPAATIPPASSGKVVRVLRNVAFTDRYLLAEGHKPSVRNGTKVQAGAILAKLAKKKNEAEESDSLPNVPDVVARTSGKIKIIEGTIEIEGMELEFRDHQADQTDHWLVKPGDTVSAGQKLTSGVKDPHDILRIEGIEPTQRYILEQVQTVYRNQGVTIDDKHIEVIARQILRWVRVETSGDTEMLPNQLIDRNQFRDINTRVSEQGGEPATSKPEILGITRASLNTDSFLAKASFQETARVLTDAAIRGEVDYLRGLKENVIIGRLIPARLDISEEGRELLGLHRPALFEPEGLGEIDMQATDLNELGLQPSENGDLILDGPTIRVVDDLADGPEDQAAPDGQQSNQSESSPPNGTGDSIEETVSLADILMDDSDEDSD